MNEEEFEEASEVQSLIYLVISYLVGLAHAETWTQETCKQIKHHMTELRFQLDKCRDPSPDYK